MNTNPELVAVGIDEGVASIRMTDEAGKNALGEPMVTALTAAFDDVSRNQNARVIVLLGGREFFSAGATKELLAALAQGQRRSADVLLPRALLCCDLPVIAAMEGHATGGGFALGLAADIVIMAKERRYGFPFLNMGFSPGMGTTRLSEHVLSAAVAHELLYTGEMRKGEEFIANSGINYVLPHDQVPAKAFSLAARIAEKPRTVLEVLKRTLSLSRRRAFESSLTLESLMHQITLPDAAGRIEDEYVE